MDAYNTGLELSCERVVLVTFLGNEMRMSVRGCKAPAWHHSVEDSRMIENGASNPLIGISHQQS